MGEVLKRWNGTEWVTLSNINRIEVTGNDGLLNNPTILINKSFNSILPKHNPLDRLNMNYSYYIE
ncbi:MAG: hypothetical protein GX660_04325 [Clostridiaceae bacterium]|nr:hypothetical protein [Clostridiaceae bacterium]